MSYASGIISASAYLLARTTHLHGARPVFQTTSSTKWQLINTRGNFTFRWEHVYKPMGVQNNTDVSASVCLCNIYLLVYKSQ